MVRIGKEVSGMYFRSVLMSEVNTSMEKICKKDKYFKRLP